MSVLKIGILILVLGMTGCAAKLVRPEVITIDRPAYVRLPSSLTDCAYVSPAIVTNGDLARAYVEVSAALRNCAADAEAVRKMQP